MDDVVIHYTRLPDRLTVFRQHFVERVGECTITLMPRTALDAPVRAGDVVILEPDAPVVWFTFDNAWHDIGRFHLADGSFTGWYANILTPVRMTSPLEWSTTDLFLDVWLGPTGTACVLDEAELADAIATGTIDTATAARARGEADRLIGLARSGVWPPAVARNWTLQRSRRHIRSGR